MTTTSSDQQRSRRPRFWVGPLVAGACFALGYGITQRVLRCRFGTSRSRRRFANSFPVRLDGLRRRYGADQPLMGDVATKEALDAAQRDANQQAEALAKEAKRREQGQQAVVAEPLKVNQESELTAEPVASPNPDLVDEVVPEVAQPAAVVSPNLLLLCLSPRLFCQVRRNLNLPSMRRQSLNRWSLNRGQPSTSL